MKDSRKSIILGIVVILLLSTAFVSAVANLTEKQISVSTGVNIYLDDIKLNPKDVNGNPIEVFVYKGTTYLPVRAISETLNIAVSWDGKTQSVYLGKHDSSQPAVMLFDMDYFTYINSYFVDTKSVTDNIGNSYNNAINLPYGSIEEYLLKGKYRKLKGRFIIDYESRGTTRTGQILVYGDDKIIYSSPKLTGGVEPIDFDIDIEGVQKLKIEFIRDNKGVSGNFYLVNSGFYQ